eukprot:TRINITY_DN16333_c0_g1_i1.p1 TRINITY_DN16333_c0_g1~~TRINITY_DN16333_c0_g1_i1.p1  ORF type:complete len:537 (+),score=171.87 TRINITY_DN16333_c0_g1_i1:145-1611(+)
MSHVINVDGQKAFDDIIEQVKEMAGFTHVQLIIKEVSGEDPHLRAQLAAKEKEGGLDDLSGPWLKPGMLGKSFRHNELRRALEKHQDLGNNDPNKDQQLLCAFQHARPSQDRVKPVVIKYKDWAAHCTNKPAGARFWHKVITEAGGRAVGYHPEAGIVLYVVVQFDNNDEVPNYLELNNNFVPKVDTTRYRGPFYERLRQYRREHGRTWPSRSPSPPPGTAAELPPSASPAPPHLKEHEEGATPPPKRQRTAPPAPPREEPESSPSAPADTAAVLQKGTVTTGVKGLRVRCTRAIMVGGKEVIAKGQTGMVHGLAPKIRGSDRVRVVTTFDGVNQIFNVFLDSLVPLPKPVTSAQLDSLPGDTSDEPQSGWSPAAMAQRLFQYAKDRFSPPPTPRSDSEVAGRSPAPQGRVSGSTQRRRSRTHRSEPAPATPPARIPRSQSPQGQQQQQQQQQQQDPATSVRQAAAAGGTKKKKKKRASGGSSSTRSV